MEYPETPRAKKLYLYLDEAGNFDFSPRGSKFFIMTCTVSSRPFGHIAELAELKYDCLEEGLDPKRHKDSHRFHATEDKQATRDAVYGIIERHLDAMSVHSVIIRKNMTDPALQDQATLYGRVFQWLVGYVFRDERLDLADEVIIVTDSIPVKKKLNDLRGALKKYLKEKTEGTGVRYRLYHHRSESDLNLQVADYCCWAIQRKWERGDDRSFKIIERAVRSEGDLFKSSSTVYYRFDGENDQPAYPR